jgi:GDP-4-dehydro-6-deoxy-D-mannose reductase
MAQTFPRRILVTGASGFVGRHLLPAIAARHPSATVYTMAVHPHPGASDYLISIDARIGDIRDPQAVRAVVHDAQPDLVIHLAGRAAVVDAWADPAGTLAINAGGAITLLEALRTTASSARVVLIGSGEQYGPVPSEESPITEQHQQCPINPYAVSKAAQELVGHQYAAAYGLDIVYARPFNHFGPYQPDLFVIASFARQIALAERGLAPPCVRVGNLSAQRDFLPVQDVVAAYLALAEGGRSDEAYNVASGIPRAISQVLDMLIAKAHVDVRIEIDPERIRPMDVPLAYADNAKLRQDTGWQPSHDFAQALEEVLQYWRSVVGSM